MFGLNVHACLSKWTIILAGSGEDPHIIHQCLHLCSETVLCSKDTLIFDIAFNPLQYPV